MNWFCFGRFASDATTDFVRYDCKRDNGLTQDDNTAQETWMVYYD